VSVSAIAIERLEARHLAQAHALSAAVGWPHRQEDWHFVLGLGRGLAAVNGDELLGTIIWWPFGEAFATLGMVIVAPAMQGRGLGRRLMDAALQEAGSRTVLLNATAEGLSLYEKLGFKPMGAVRQHQAANAVPAFETLPEGGKLRPLTEADLDAVIGLDARAAGFGRAEMLTALAHVGQGLILEQDGAIAAWSFFRRFGRGYVIGPVGAREERSAKALIAAWIAEHGSAFLRIDIPVSTGLSPWLEAQGLPQVGEVVTMARGTAPAPDSEGPRLFALANQALG
jgi:GNAT superfamily N-acetyltransferase